MSECKFVPTNSEDASMSPIPTGEGGRLVMQTEDWEIVLDGEIVGLLSTPTTDTSTYFVRMQNPIQFVNFFAPDLETAKCLADGFVKVMLNYSPVSH